MTTGTLGVVDYIVWIILLMMSLAIGFLFGFLEYRRKKTHVGGETQEFLLGGRKMSSVPVACSLMSSFFSALTLLGTPNETYQDGFMYWFIGFGFSINIVIAILFYIPVFYHLNITSSYQYLAMRFSKVNQLFGSIAFIFQMVPYMGIVLYGPCLALQILMNVNLWIPVIVTCVICTSYTTIGGLKAVVWTDVLQLVLMFCGMVSIIFKGSADLGGFNNVWRINSENGRTEVIWSFDPRTRHALPAVVIGGAIMWLGIYGINQTMIQRAISIKNIRHVNIAYLLNIPGLVVLLTIVIFCGLTIYAVFHNCDPLISKQIEKSDQLSPFYVGKYLTTYPGVAGVFAACIFSGGLSTLSSGLNALSAVTLQDIIMVKWNKIPDNKAAIISKGLVVVYGLLMLIFAYLSSLTSKILEAALALFGLLSGPTLGVFTLGMFFPFANEKGAISGHVFSQLILSWIVFGSIATQIQHPKLDLTYNNCTGLGMFYKNRSYEIKANGYPLEGITNLYAISYLWYTLYGLLMVLLIGIPVSLLTDGLQQKVEEQFITPLLRGVWKNYLKENTLIYSFKSEFVKEDKSIEVEQESTKL